MCIAKIKIIVMHIIKPHYLYGDRCLGCPTNIGTFKYILSFELCKHYDDKHVSLKQLTSYNLQISLNQCHLYAALCTGHIHQSFFIDIWLQQKI